MIPAPLLAIPAAGGDRTAELIVLLGVATLAPLALATLTSFLKISVVLSILRHALGAPQLPPATAINGLALLLSILVMAPVAEPAFAALRSARAGAGLSERLERLQAAAAPFRAFLARHARPEDRATFAALGARRGAPSAAGDEDAFAVLAPAFVVSELRRAFTAGFLVFVPFLVVDLLVANVLLSLGLTQLSPGTFALPFKLLLFVAVDGWRLLSQSLVLSYGVGP